MSAAKILLADSNIGDQFLLKELVHQLDRNWLVYAVSSARQTLRYLNHLAHIDYPELILVDYNIPVRGAMDLIERLTKDPRYSGIPKFVWSSMQHPGVIEQFHESGAQAFLQKPQKASEAKALVRRLLVLH